MIYLAANSTIHTTTQLSPFFLMYGRQLNLPIDIAHRGLHMENKDDAIPFPHKAANHATRIVQKMAKVLKPKFDILFRIIHELTQHILHLLDLRG